MSTSIEALAFNEMLRVIQKAMESNSTVQGFLEDLHFEGFMVVEIPPPEALPQPEPATDDHAVMIPALESGFAEWLDSVTAAGGKVNLADAGDMRAWRKYWQDGVPAPEAKDMFEMPF